MKELLLILVEAALEAIPKELWGHPLIKKYARERGKHPSRLLLDRSYHHRAMLKLKDGLKRGRPDLVHFSILEATATPLYRDGRLRLYLHTYDDKIISLGEGVRPPKSYHRFQGLMEQLLERGSVMGDGRELLRLERGGLQELLRGLSPSIVIGLTRRGSFTSCRALAEKLVRYERPSVLVGGFPRGGFSPLTTKLIHEAYAIHEAPLEAHVVIARILYEVEVSLKALKL